MGGNQHLNVAGVYRALFENRSYLRGHPADRRSFGSPIGSPSGPPPRVAPARLAERMIRATTPAGPRVLVSALLSRFTRLAPSRTP